MIATALTAQSATVSVDALTPQLATVGDETKTWVGSLPVGPLPASGLVSANQAGGAPRGVTLSWVSQIAAGGARYRLTQFVSNGPPGTYGETGLSEQLLTIAGTGSAVAPWRLEAEILELTPGLDGPLFLIDVGNDGTIDWTPDSFGPTCGVGADLNATPLEVRVVYQAGQYSADLALTTLELRVVPADVDVLRISSNCENPNTFSAIPLMWSSDDVAIASSAATGTSWQLLGFTTAPTILPVSLTGTPMPCLALPFADWLYPTSSSSLRVPAAVRPLSFYAQSLDFTFGNLRTSDTFLITSY